MGRGDPIPGVCHRRAEEDRRRGGALERRAHGVQAHVQGAVGELLEQKRTLDQTDITGFLADGHTPWDLAV